ncbi:TraI/MobA(P) family conjugative relaxase [Polaromonas sp. DSP2-3-2b2]|uniref:TraI/MobA(P) family conjugative relaxase n=1 Tax=Polaromonas sp. DSP2-3-2b2 TaxID=2804662 RepID=UPI003CF52262
MICKKIPNTKKSSTKSARVSGLVEYISQPELSNKIEKCIFSEAINFFTDDLKSQTLEMIALSQEGVKSKDPIDHWVLSWKSHERPTPEQAREAAAIFIKQCRLDGHQYIIGLHDDTENMHLHIALNRVHPDTCKVVKINKGFDKEAGQQAIAIIEKVQGWSVEKNARYLTTDKAELIIDTATKRPQIFTAAEKPLQPTTQAQAMEIQTGQKSVQRIAIEKAAPIIAQATSWKELHANMAAAGLEYRRDGSGAKVYVGDIGVKASNVDRKASFGHLQKRFGPYQPRQEIKPNEYHNTSRNFTEANAKKPHAIAHGKNARHGLRNLSACTLAHSEKDKRASRPRILQLDVSPDRREAGGLRWDTGRAVNTQLTPQPMRQGQPGWNEYISSRDAQKAAKTHDIIELQKRHGAEREALGAKQKAKRTELLLGDWKGKGGDRNALQSITATQQAAEKLELKERHGDERKALQAQYKPLPIYKQWKEQPQIVSLHILPVIKRSTVVSTSTVASTLRALTSTVDARKHITYQLAQKDVFRDEGRTIAILDLKSDQGIAAALATAQQKFGNVLTLTGSEEFKKNAVALAVASGLTCRFSDPSLDKLREILQQQKYQAQQDARQAERDHAAAEQLEKSKVLEKHPSVPLHSPSNNRGEAVSLDSGPQTLAPEQAAAGAAKGVQEAMARVKKAAALTEAHRIERKEKAESEKATRAERDRVAAAQLEKSNKEPGPLHSPSNNPGEAVSVDSKPQTLNPEQAAANDAQGVQEAMAQVKEAAAQVEAAEAQKVAAPRTGKMTGTVMAVDGRQFALAKNRKGDLIWHNMENLPESDLPKVGEIVKIDYVNGVGKVAVKVPSQGQGR